MIYIFNWSIYIKNYINEYKTYIFIYVKRRVNGDCGGGEKRPDNKHRHNFLYDVLQVINKNYTYYCIDQYNTNNTIFPRRVMHYVIE